MGFLGSRTTEVAPYLVFRKDAMTSAPIPEDIQKFLDAYIPSVEQLEVLLLLQENPTQEWRANDVSRALYRQLESAARQLDALVGHGLVTLTDGSERQYRYDPSDPTPAIGGAARSLGQERASVDNRSLEARPDVLTYTSTILGRDAEVSGPVSAELFVRSPMRRSPRRCC